MIDKVLISEEELRNYGQIDNLSQKAAALLNHQKKHWELVDNNFRALDRICTEDYNFDDFYIRTQFNPSRIISSSAKVDEKSISSRPCFLCTENLPKVQKGIVFKDKFIILCNPYPIFAQHLTIPYYKHVPQNIESSLKDLLELSFELKDNFFVFYNGPKCGASAPDHLHFQAGLKNSTPLEDYYRSLMSNASTLYVNDDTDVKYINNQLFSFFIIRSNSQPNIENVVCKLLNCLKDFQSSGEEPLLNIISFFEQNIWNVFIVPRKKHRPKQFFLEGNAKLLISPASVDMTGLLITPREEDFKRINGSLIVDIYRQVLFDKNIFEYVQSIF